MMRRVVVTGVGILSSIGSEPEEVVTALRNSSSGMIFMPDMMKLGLKCCVYGPVKNWDPKRLNKRMKQTMPTIAQYAVVASLNALQDAGIEQDSLRNDRTGISVGTSFGGINVIYPIEKLVKQKKPSRAGMTGVVKVMNSTASGNLASHLGIQGRTHSISSSFSTGMDNIGYAYELIKYGLQDICICGSAEEDCRKQIGIHFDNWGGKREKWNMRPTEAYRPYDRDRQGPVMSEGAGILILEEMGQAKRRNARIYAEVIGYGSANDGADMFQPTGEGLKLSMEQAMNAASNQTINGIDYINTHGTGTMIEDEMEVRVIKELFGEPTPLLSSTKGLTGHGLGATGAQEAVYTLLMLHDNFIAPTVNLDNISQECTGVQHVKSLMEKSLTTVMTFNVGLGGANSCLVFQKV